MDNLLDLDNESPNNAKKPLWKRVGEKFILGAAGGVVLLMAGWVWEIKSDVNQLQSDGYVAFSALAEVETRSNQNEIRSSVNEQMRLFTQQIMAIAIGKELDMSQLQSMQMHQVYGSPEYWQSLEDNPNDPNDRDNTEDTEPQSTGSYPPQQMVQPNTPDINTDQYIKDKRRMHKK